MYTIRATRRGIDRTEKSIVAEGPALERGVPALLGSADLGLGTLAALLGVGRGDEVARA